MVLVVVVDATLILWLSRQGCPCWSPRNRLRRRDHLGLISQVSSTRCEELHTAELAIAEPIESSAGIDSAALAGTQRTRRGKVIVF